MPGLCSTSFGGQSRWIFTIDPKYNQTDDFSLVTRAVRMANKSAIQGHSGHRPP